MKLEEITKQCAAAAEELINVAGLKKGNVVIIGCSSSEIAGEKIGTLKSPEIANAVYAGLYPVFSARGIYMAAQCCEHLNRAVIIEAECAEKLYLDEVNVVPQPSAGGSFAAEVYKNYKGAVAVEKIKAHAGLDIGDTLIGMHLKEVAVPVRLALKKIGCANLVAARTRPKFIGGERAVYNAEKL